MLKDLLNSPLYRSHCEWGLDNPSEYMSERSIGGTHRTCLVNFVIYFWRACWVASVPIGLGKWSIGIWLTTQFQPSHYDTTYMDVLVTSIEANRGLANDDARNRHGNMVLIISGVELFTSIRWDSMRVCRYPVTNLVHDLPRFSLHMRSWYKYRRLTHVHGHAPH